MTEAADNREVFNAHADVYDDLSLQAAERAVLVRLGPRLHEFSMLDLGVGTGRTGYTFAPIVRRYVGLDYAPAMIERARQLLGTDPNVTLIEGDARDLSAAGGPFDFVLFSFNGLDAVPAEDRETVLKQVHEVLAPGGHFLFSSHSLGALPLERRRRRSPRMMRSAAYRAYARLDDFRFGRRIDRINDSIDLGAARDRGWTVVHGRAHDAVDDYYVDPEYQLGQLRDCGLEAVAVYNNAGEEVEVPYAGSDPWLDYLCQPLGSGAGAS